MKIICNNGAAICTPDNFAVKARIKRAKNAMRDNIAKHQIRMNNAYNKRAQLARKFYTLAGILCGLSYVGLILTMPLGV